MSLLELCSISRCMQFHAIADDAAAGEIGPDKDLFVGRKKHVTLHIPNGETIRVRDIVVLGKLTIQSTDINSAERVVLVARDFFVAGHFEATNVDLSCRHYRSYKNFQKELVTSIMDWFSFQRGCAEKMGLRPVVLSMN